MPSLLQCLCQLPTHHLTCNQGSISKTHLVLSLSHLETKHPQTWPIIPGPSATTLPPSSTEWRLSSTEWSVIHKTYAVTHTPPGAAPALSSTQKALPVPHCLPKFDSSFKTQLKGLFLSPTFPFTYCRSVYGAVPLCQALFRVLDAPLLRLSFRCSHDLLSKTLLNYFSQAGSSFLSPTVCLPHKTELPEDGITPYTSLLSTQPSKSLINVYWLLTNNEEHEEQLFGVSVCTQLLLTPEFDSQYPFCFTGSGHSAFPKLLLWSLPCSSYLKPPPSSPPELWCMILYKVARNILEDILPILKRTRKPGQTSTSKVPKVLQGFSESPPSTHLAMGRISLPHSCKTGIHFIVFSPVTWARISYFHLWNFIFKYTSFQCWWKMTHSSMKYEQINGTDILW